MTRIAWAELPTVARTAIERHTGPILRATDIDGGLNSAAAARLRAPSGDLFAKAAADGTAGARHQTREAAIAPWLPPVAPTVVAHVHAAGWHLLATAWLDARHADLTPGSPDLDAVAETLADTSRCRPPDTAPLPPLADLWDGHATPAETRLLTGDHLVHTDIHAENILVSGDRAWLIDWGMCTRGPAWIDTAETAVRLLENGYTAADVLTWATRVPAWRDAPPDAVAAWVDVSCRHWEALTGPDDAAPGIARLRALRPAAAEAWVRRSSAGSGWSGRRY